MLVVVFTLVSSILFIVRNMQESIFVNWMQSILALYCIFFQWLQLRAKLLDLIYIKLPMDT